MALTREQKIDKMWDIMQIKNLMYKYAYYGFADDPKWIVAQFAPRDDIFVDCEGMGIFDGPAGVKKFFVDWHKSLNGDPHGVFAIHVVNNGVIEVADDGKTARGLWFSPGAESKHRAGDNELEAYWIWGRYAVDFIKADDRWYFWHFRIPHGLLCDYHHSWVDVANVPLGSDIGNVSGKPTGDRPSGYPPYHYTKDILPDSFFMPPEPYGTETDLDGFWEFPDGHRKKG